jgi:alpha-1,3-rhamnosyl/mannosyltransferase
LKQRLWHRAVRSKAQILRAAAVIVPSEHTKRDVCGAYGVPQDRVQVIPWGASPVFAPRETPQEKMILFLGSIERRKNVDGLIEAFCLWKNDHPEAAPYTLTLAGPLGHGGEAICKKAARRTDIRYIGYVPEAEKSALYARASLFVYPSFYEGFGMPVLEAFASGVPVVTSNRSSLPELAGGAAYLVNPYNVAAIADGLQRVLADDALRANMIAAGRARAAQFRWEEAARRLMDIFYAHRH